MLSHGHRRSTPGGGGVRATPRAGSLRSSQIKASKTVLDNGLRILSHSMPGTRSVSICVFVGAGSRYEEDAQAGVSHFLEHMLFKGTHRRPTSVHITSAIEEVGGMLNGSTDREVTNYWCKVASPDFHTALDVLIDMVRDSLLDPLEVEKERNVVVEELSASNDYPNYRAELLIDEMLWPNQPMGRDVGGTKESVRGITRGMMADYLQGQYVASNVVISVAGDATHQEVVEAVAPLVDRWSQEAPRAWIPATHDDQTEPKVRVEYRKTEQAHLLLALPGISTYHPDRYALDIMSTVLGEGMSSRLFVEVREKRGLAYEIHSSTSHFRDTGSFVVYCGVDPKKAAYAVQTVLSELHRLKDGVPAEELERAKGLAKGRLLLRMEDSRAVAGWIGAQELLRDQVLTVDEVVEQINAVSSGDVGRVANEHLVQEKLNLAVVGPFRTDRPFRTLLSA